MRDRYDKLWGRFAALFSEGVCFTMDTIDRLLPLLDSSPSPYHAVATAARLLADAGFARLEETAPWALTAGGGYFVTRNQSSLLAFRLPSGALRGWRMTAAHSDSPTFAVKGDRLDGGPYVRLPAEGYGGMNCASWLDRPLTVAGRAAVRTGRGLEMRLVYLDMDLLTIPSLAIHQQRDVNRGHEYNAQRDMQPLWGLPGGASLSDLVAAELGVEPSAILARDLVLCPRQKAVRLGADGALFQSPRIDDLACAYATLEGFLGEAPQEHLGQMWCLFDSEEVGSGTRQGALGTFLPDTLARVGEALGMTDGDCRRAAAASLLLSADNGHAAHPNFPEKADPANRVLPNGGVAVKYAASQKYTTSALTAGLFLALCRDAGIPTQTFANRADEPGGSTLGNLLARQVSIPMADVGLAQLSMHSAVETAGSDDPGHLARAAAAFYRFSAVPTADGTYCW